MKIKYTLILPSYNEFENLKILIPEIFKCFNHNNYQIIVVDDNSEDNSTKNLKKIFKAHKKITYILRKKKRDLGLSINEGIKKAKGDFLIVMDSDFNHRPKDLKKMIKKFETSNVDMTCGSRFLKGGASTSHFRYICSLIFNLFVNLFTNGNLSDNLSGFFIIKKRFLKNNQSKIFYGYGEFYIRLLFYMQRKKIKINEIAVKYGKRKYGYSKSRFLKMFILYAYETIKLLK